MELKVDTKGYGGRTLRQTAKVISDDPEKSEFQIVVTGKVDRFVTIRPSRVRLSGQVGSLIKEKVAIVPEAKYPFKLQEVKAEKGEYIKYSLNQVQTPNGLEYELDVINQKDAVGRYMDTLVLTTDSKVMPELRIVVYGNIFKQP